MAFIVKAEYRGTTRKFAFPTFPDWHEIHAQLYKSFQLPGSYVLSHLLLSHRDDPSTGRILISIEVASSEQYDAAVQPFVPTHRRGGVLKCTIVDVPRRKEPAQGQLHPDLETHVTGVGAQPGPSEESEQERRDVSFAEFLSRMGGAAPSVDDNEDDNDNNNIINVNNQLSPMHTDTEDEARIGRRHRHVSAPVPAVGSDGDEHVNLGSGGPATATRTGPIRFGLTGDEDDEDEDMDRANQPHSASNDERNAAPAGLEPLFRGRGRHSQSLRAPPTFGGHHPLHHHRRERGDQLLRSLSDRVNAGVAAANGPRARENSWAWRHQQRLGFPPAPPAAPGAFDVPFIQGRGRHHRFGHGGDYPAHPPHRGRPGPPGPPPMPPHFGIPGRFPGQDDSSDREMPFVRPPSPPPPPPLPPLPSLMPGGYPMPGLSGPAWRTSSPPPPPPPPPPPAAAESGVNEPVERAAGVGDRPLPIPPPPPPHPATALPFPPWGSVAPAPRGGMAFNPPRYPPPPPPPFPPMGAFMRPNWRSSDSSNNTIGEGITISTPPIQVQPNHVPSEHPNPIPMGPLSYSGPNPSTSAAPYLTPFWPRPSSPPRGALRPAPVHDALANALRDREVQEKEKDEKNSSAASASAAEREELVRIATPTPIVTPVRPVSAATTPANATPSFNTPLRLPAVPTRTPSMISTTSTASEEVKDLITGFVDVLNETLSRNGMSELSLVQALERESEKQAMETGADSDNTVEGVHRGVYCDHCGQLVKGTRYKCSNCANFDLCHSCVTERNAKENHSLYHHFHKLMPPAVAAVSSTPSSEKSAKIPTGGHAVHPATCDNCQKRIVGVRHKCGVCADYDLCDNCYTNYRGAHRLEHAFQHHANPRDAPIALPGLFNPSANPIDTLRRGIQEFVNYSREAATSAATSASEAVTPAQGSLLAEVRDRAGEREQRRKARAERRASRHGGHHGHHHRVPAPSAGDASTPSASDSNTNANANAKKQPAHPAHCDACPDSSQPIRGIRFKCLDCADYDMCSTCVVERRGQHPLEHEFVALHDPLRRVQVHVVYDEAEQELPTPDEVEGQTRSASIVGSSRHGRRGGKIRHNAFCDACRQDIDNVRWKCVDCVDFDFCSACFAKQEVRAAHRGGAHKFVKFTEPGEIWVRRGREDSTTSASTPAPVPAPAPTFDATAPSTGAEEGHNATCDMCESRIVGVRFKCTRCPDYDVCASCFTITKEQHPHHAFVKVTKPKDIMSPTEQFTDVHPAICNSCKTHIIGIRYKCLHPMCADVDLCAHCEALPIPVHPVDHPLVKFKHDYVGGRTYDYSKVFEFVNKSGLKYERAELGSAMFFAPPVPVAPRAPSPVQPTETKMDEEMSEPEIEVKTEKLDKGKGRAEGERPHVEVMIPRPQLEIDFPQVPTEEPVMMHAEPVQAVAEPVLDGGYLIESSRAVNPATFMDAPNEELATQPLIPSSVPATPQIAAPEMIEPVVIPTPAPPTLSAAFVADNSIDDGHLFPAGAEFVKSWRVKNDGLIAWPENTVLSFMGGNRFAPSETENGRRLCLFDYPVGRVEPGESVDVEADMKAPGEGRWVSYWRLREGVDGNIFGDQLWCDITVEDSANSSMSSSSIVMMPAAAPQDVANSTPATPAPIHTDVAREDSLLLSPSTLRSSSPTWSTSGSSVWEDAARPTGELHRVPSGEFVFVDDDDM